MTSVEPQLAVLREKEPKKKETFVLGLARWQGTVPRVTKELRGFE